jgi:hypothetical protein
MVTLFLYQRLYQLAERQLEALRKRDMASFAVHTRERDLVGEQLARSVSRSGPAPGNESDDPTVDRRIANFTRCTVRIDSEIHERLEVTLQRSFARLLSLDDGPEGTPS